MTDRTDDNRIAHGRCLCGQVQIRAVLRRASVVVCHCKICRTWAGGPMFAVRCQGQDIALDGEPRVQVFASSATAERGFCDRCGTHLFFRSRESGQWALPVGLFDDRHAWHLDEQIFLDDKPDFYTLCGHDRGEPRNVAESSNER